MVNHGPRVLGVILDTIYKKQKDGRKTSWEEVTVSHIHMDGQVHSYDFSYSNARLL